MNNGQLLAEDRMENLVRRLTDENELDIELAEGKPQAIDELEGLDFVNEVSVDGKFLRVKVKTDRDYRLDVVLTLISQGHVPVGIQARSMSFEEAFVTITKENISLLAKVES
jgi:hypothetical protein